MVPFGNSSWNNGISTIKNDPNDTNAAMYVGRDILVGHFDLELLRFCHQKLLVDELIGDLSRQPHLPSGIGGHLSPLRPLDIDALQNRAPEDRLVANDSHHPLERNRRHSRERRIPIGHVAHRR